MTIKANYNRLRKSIAESAARCGRDPSDIKIISVSKTFGPEVIQEAIDSGITLFGENKIQEAREKIPRLSGSPVFHMVGHLQSNKAKEAVQLFDLVHSIDKISTARAVNKEAEKIDRIQKILVQVNTSGEDSKSGTTAEKTFNLIDEISDLKNVEVLGLMTIAPFTDNDDLIRNSFKQLHGLLNEYNAKNNAGLTELSMGMSSDYIIAIEEGATMVRIGTAIFGNRTAL